MQLSNLSTEQETLRRAMAIADQAREPGDSIEGYEGLLSAAAEAGIPRAAMLQAMREQHLIPAEEFQLGQTVFAPSLDNHWYLGEISGLDGPSATVRFLTGGEHRCSLTDLRPMSLVPGRRLQADCKGWGWWDAWVKEYRPDSGKVRVVYDDWIGTEETLSLRKLRLSREIACPAPTMDLPTRHRSALLRFGAVAGGLGLAAGLLLAQFLPHLLSLFR